MIFQKENAASSIGKDAVFQLPIYLEKDVDEFMHHLADTKGKDVGELVNELLRRNIQLIQTIQ